MPKKVNSNNSAKPKEAAKRKSKAGLKRVFYFFPKLPIELRLMIWQLAMPRGAIHEVNFRSGAENCSRPHHTLCCTRRPLVYKLHGHPWDKESNFRHGLKCLTPYPALFWVSRESREEAFKRFTLSVGRAPSVYPVGTTFSKMELCPPSVVQERRAIVRKNPNHWSNEFSKEGPTVDAKDPLSEVTVTGEMPGVGYHFTRTLGPNPQLDIEHGLLVEYHQRTYVNPSVDTIYFNWLKAEERKIFDNCDYSGLRTFGSLFPIETTNIILHIAIDIQFWFGAQWDLDSKYLRAIHPELNGASDLERKLFLLRQHGVFMNVETITLVINDYIDKDPSYPRPHVFNYSARYGIFHHSPVEFTDTVKLPARKRMSSGNGWEYIGKTLSANFDFRQNSVETVDALIKSTQKCLANEAMLLRDEKPHLNVPQFEWKFGTRRGKWALPNVKSHDKDYHLERYRGPNWR